VWTNKVSVLVKLANGFSRCEQRIALANDPRLHNDRHRERQSQDPSDGGSLS
jgi:hypothetical protein